MGATSMARRHRALSKMVIHQLTQHGYQGGPLQGPVEGGVRGQTGEVLPVHPGFGYKGQLRIREDVLATCWLIISTDHHGIPQVFQLDLTYFPDNRGWGVAGADLAPDREGHVGAQVVLGSCLEEVASRLDLHLDVLRRNWGREYGG